MIFVASEPGTLQASQPGLLIASVSNSPAAFNSPRNPNLLPVTSSATARQVPASSSSVSQLIRSLNTRLIALRTASARASSGGASPPGPVVMLSVFLAIVTSPLSCSIRSSDL